MTSRAVVASLDYWTSPTKLGGHHFARGLASRGWEVAYVSWPISPIHLLSRERNVLRARLDIYRRGGIQDLSGLVWAYVPGALATPYNRPLLRSRWLHRNWSKLTYPNLGGLLRSRGFGAVDLIYIDVPIHLRLLDVVQAKRSLMRIPDRLSGFGHLAPAMLEVEREAAGKVDLVTYTARSLESHVRELRVKRSLYVPNGVDFALFSQGPSVSPADLASIPRPIAIYVGAMREWFDFQSIDHLAQARPDVSIVLIGPADLARARLMQRANLHLLGPRPNAEIPGYLRSASVGLIPFDATGYPDLVNSVHPLKLYEYLAAGLPVVARRWDELASLHSPAVLYESHEEMVRAVGRVLDDAPDPIEGVQFARRADWSNRVDDLLDALDLIE